MTLSEIEAILRVDPASLPPEAGIAPDAVSLPVRIRRAISYYRRALQYAPITALQDDMRDQRFDAALMARYEMPKEKIDAMCAAYERRAHRQHIRALARRVASRLKETSRVATEE